jgi:nucleotide-binding universal stress UspA family protein
MDDKILIPLDGSKMGEAAIPAIEKFIGKLSPDINVEVILLGVVTVLRHWVVVGEASTPIAYTEEEIKSIKQQVMNYLEKTGQGMRNKGVTVKCVVRTGDATEEILKTAQASEVDMIAMSTHGRSGLSRLAFGSITEKVLREAKVPVLTVRATEETTNAS